MKSFTVFIIDDGDYEEDDISVESIEECLRDGSFNVHIIVENQIEED
jgi:hypothetical protein